jgi:putative PIG3 family NAD(P)H quinone oxidoreductase
MTAIVVTRAGGPEVLQPETRPVPRPAAEQVLIKVAFAGINRRDCEQRSRGFLPPEPSDIPGVEVAGEVIATGAGVKRWKPGDRVCALVNGSGYAQYCIAAEPITVPIPAGFDLRQAASLPENLFTAWLNVFMLGRLKSGEWLLVHGGSSGVGTMTIQLARREGANVVATAGNAAKCDVCVKLGAASAINYREQDFVAGVRSATDGHGADVILDMIGGDYAKRNLEALATDGRLVHLSRGNGAEFCVAVDAIMSKGDRLALAGLGDVAEDRDRPSGHGSRLASSRHQSHADHRLGYSVHEGRRGSCPHGIERAHRQDLARGNPLMAARFEAHAKFDATRIRTRRPDMICRTRLSYVTNTLALLAFCAAAGVAQAAEPEYPTRPIRLLVGFAPGGGVDALARIISPKLSDVLSQTWVVDNRGGAGGNLATEIVAHANPDGYTVLMALNTQLTVNPSLYKLPFSVEKDLQPITMLAAQEHILVLHPSVPAKTLKEFVALAKQRPGALNYASAGVGSSVHLGAELLKKRAGIDMVHVAYKGTGLAIAAMLAGETQVMVGGFAPTIAYVKAGRLRALATTGAKRSKVLPELPTVAESGYPGLEVLAWFALLVPGATPKSIAERIRNEALKVIQHADVQAAMARQGLDPETSTRAELAARIKTETAMWAGIIKDLGIRAE